jgi:hypothetical protein
MVVAMIMMVVTVLKNNVLKVELLKLQLKYVKLEKAISMVFLNQLLQLNT